MFTYLFTYLLRCLRQDLDNETLLHIDAENRRQTLEEELEFLKQVHEQVTVCFVYTSLRGVTTVASNFVDVSKNELNPFNASCSKLLLFGESMVPYWSNPPFLIFDIRTLWRSVLSARAPECQK